MNYLNLPVTSSVHAGSGCRVRRSVISLCTFPPLGRFSKALRDLMWRRRRDSNVNSQQALIQHSTMKNNFLDIFIFLWKPVPPPWRRPCNGDVPRGKGRPWKLVSWTWFRLFRCVLSTMPCRGIYSMPTPLPTMAHGATWLEGRLFFFKTKVLLTNISGSILPPKSPALFKCIG